MDHRGAFDLGNQDSIGSGSRDHRDIGGTPRCLEAVHADDELASAIAALLERRGNLLAGRGLRVGRYRILEIENKPIGRERTRLLDRAGIGARHIKHTPAWPRCLVHRSLEDPHPIAKP